jgi:hypothetical protein
MTEELLKQRGVKPAGSIDEVEEPILILGSDLPLAEVVEHSKANCDCQLAEGTAGS